MKKVIILMVALTLTLGSQAQFETLVRKAVQSSVEQKLGAKQIQQPQKDPVNNPEQKDVKADENRLPTPEEVMAMVPQIPQPQHLSDYACEQNRANPRTLKLIANPTTAFLAQMIKATASGYVVMMGGAKAGSVYNFDEQLLKEFGITQEKYDAMSEEEQEKLALELASELEDRYQRTAEWLASDKEYNAMMEEYTAVENDIQRRYNDVDSICRNMWKDKYGSKEKATEDDMCQYFRMAMPLQYKVVMDVMKIRKTRQLVIAKRMDEYVQKMAEKNPKEVFAGFYNQGGICATSYVSDAARLTVLSDPR